MCCFIFNCALVILVFYREIFFSSHQFSNYMINRLLFWPVSGRCLASVWPVYRAIFARGPWLGGGPAGLLTKSTLFPRCHVPPVAVT